MLACQVVGRSNNFFSSWHFWMESTYHCHQHVILWQFMTLHDTFGRSQHIIVINILFYGILWHFERFLDGVNVSLLSTCYFMTLHDTFGRSQRIIAVNMLFYDILWHFMTLLEGVNVSLPSTYYSIVYCAITYYGHLYLIWYTVNQSTHNIMCLINYILDTLL